MTGTRAQIFTLEGLLAALIVLAGLAFALQAVVVTPSSGGGATAPANVQDVDSVLRETVSDGSLKRATLDWTPAGFQGSGAGSSYYVGDYPGNEFGEALEQAFDSSVAVNVVIYYEDGSGRHSQRLIYNGAPGSGTVRASTTVTIFDSDELGPQGTSVAAGDFYVSSDRYSGSDVYTVLEVEVVAWQP